jgi:ferrous iron transport protein B
MTPTATPASPAPPRVEPASGDIGRPSRGPDGRGTAEPAASPAPILLVGQPNVGKSVLFGRLTKTYVTVSNYPGTTVEITRGRAADLDGRPPIIDSPGVNSLVPTSEDEEVTRRLVLETPDARIIQVGDAKNLRRTLLLTLELADLGVPMILVLNMSDEALARGIEVDTTRLSARLGIPVVATVATRGVGLEEMKRSLDEARPVRFRALAHSCAGVSCRRCGSKEKPATAGVTPATTTTGAAGAFDAVMAAATASVAAAAPSPAAALTANLSPAGVPKSSRSRLALVEDIVGSCERALNAKASPLARLADAMVHPVFGWPFVGLALWLTYLIVGQFGAGTAVDFVENTLFNEYINPFLIGLVNYIPWDIVRDLLVGEFGIITMALTYAIAIVLPIVFFFFIVFGALEDSGYLPRLAVVLNNAMQRVGLNGKAVLPMVLGLGCDTMATLTTRILDTKKEKMLVTLLLALAVPCAAQLAVIFALAASMPGWVMLTWGGVIVGCMAGVGWAASKLIPGDRSLFLLELPPLRIPSMGNILQKTWARMRWYLEEAVPLFVIGTVLLFVLDRTGILPLIEKAAAPVVVSLLNLPAEAAAAFVAGFLRRDYGAVFLGEAAEAGLLSPVQVTTALVTLTLFIPCVANFLVMIRERGWKTAGLMAAFIVPFAFLVGAAVNFALRAVGLS